MNKKNKNIYIYFLEMLFIFIAINLLMMLVSTAFTTSSFVAKYGKDLIFEIFYAFAILIVMLLFKNYYVFTERKVKFWKSVCFGLPMLLITLVTFSSNIVTINDFSLSSFINVLALSIFVGIAEEFLCRGWLQNEFIERYAGDKKTVIKSILLASFVFGFMHIINIGTQTIFETILQIINATALGFLLGSIYYKTKNIWSVIFLHAFYDFAILLGEMNLVKDCTYGTPTFGIVITSLISIAIISVLWIFSALKVLNSVNYDDVKASKKKNALYTTIIIISFLLVFVPFEKLAPGYDKYEICYDYLESSKLENYEEHYPHYKQYYINEKNEVSKFGADEFSDNLEEIISEESYSISFKLNDNGTVNVKNAITTYEVKLDIPYAYNLEVLDNEDNYIVIIASDEDEDTIYYNNLNKADLRNSKDYIDFIASSFTKYSLPNITKVGYVTVENNNDKNPYFVTSNNNYFIIKNDKLFLLK